MHMSERPGYTLLGKLRRVLNFLNKNKGGDCVIGYDNIYCILTYVDESYATHNDMRGHNGGCMNRPRRLKYNKYCHNQ